MGLISRHSRSKESINRHFVYKCRLHRGVNFCTVVRYLYAVSIPQWGRVSSTILDLNQFNLQKMTSDLRFRLGGSGPVIWSYFAEFQPKLKRGSMLSSMAAFWTLGNLFVASNYFLKILNTENTARIAEVFNFSGAISGLAWIIIPQTIGHYSEGFTYKSWQIFLALCSIPSFIVAVLLLYLPESPKFLISNNEHDKALKVFKRIYQTNTGKDQASYPVQLQSVHLVIVIRNILIVIAVFYRRKV